jgi:hypothetical protein
VIDYCNNRRKSLGHLEGPAGTVQNSSSSGPRFSVRPIAPSQQDIHGHREQSAASGLANLGPGLHVAPSPDQREEPIEVPIARDQREAAFAAGGSQQRVICQ